MSDDIIQPKAILSLDEARKIAGTNGDTRGVGKGSDYATKDFVLTTALGIASGVGERVYNTMGDQQARALESIEAACLAAVDALRSEIEGRTLKGRWQRLRAWFKWRQAADTIPTEARHPDAASDIEIATRAKFNAPGFVGIVQVHCDECGTPIEVERQPGQTGELAWVRCLQHPKT